VILPTDSGTDSGDTGGPSLPPSKIEHVVVLVQENHPFDAYFGRLLHGARGLESVVHDGPLQASH